MSIAIRLKMPQKVHHCLHHLHTLKSSFMTLAISNKPSQPQHHHKVTPTYFILFKHTLNSRMDFS